MRTSAPSSLGLAEHDRLPAGSVLRQVAELKKVIAAVEAGADEMIKLVLLGGLSGVMRPECHFGPHSTGPVTGRPARTLSARGRSPPSCSRLAFGTGHSLAQVLVYASLPVARRTR